VSARVDHLVVAAATLDDGVRWCEAMLGVTPGPGGQHPLMSTHNRLLRIDGPDYPNAYFEIVAVDPRAPPPGRARWFGMDALDLSGGPRPVGVVARVDDLDATLAALGESGINAGRALAASRETVQGPLSWRIAVRDDGQLLFGGALPALIEWGERHPVPAMAPSRLRLRALTLRGFPPAAASVLGLHAVMVDGAPGPALQAQIESPRGLVTLSSS
jgi:hypothetical protein